MTRHLILDTETTGLSPQDGHRIIELACLEMVNHITTGRTWHWYFDPQRDVPIEAVRVHGLTYDFLRDKPLFSDVAQDILELLDGAHLVAHNAPFDVGFLNAEFARCGLDANCAHVTDTLALARRKHPGGRHTLDALCKLYKVDARARTKHGALVDCELLAEVFVGLIGGRQAALELTDDLREGEARVAALGRTVALPPRITAEELEAHAAFVAALGDRAIWLGGATT
jgi:DNA polymerase-3 subunit epsilon